jgi:hypothetical protein
MGDALVVISGRRSTLDLIRNVEVRAGAAGTRRCYYVNVRRWPD